MFAPKIATNTFNGESAENYPEMEKFILLSLTANSISQDALAKVKEEGWDALNARAILLIYSHITGPARTHLQDLSTAVEMLAKLKEVYVKSNPLALKILKDQFQALEFLNEDPNLFYTRIKLLQSKINALTTESKFKITEEDVLYQFIVSMLTHSTLAPMANAWLVDMQSNKLKMTIPDMIQAVAMHRLQEDILTTKKAANKMPLSFHDKINASTRRPCKFCKGDHWDRECDDAPDCYKTPKHSVRTCPECQAAYAEKKKNKI